MKKIIITAIATILSANAMAYEINGNSDDGFVLKCKDGTTNTSSMPPNHNTATEFCADHGGIAAGYPKKNIGKAEAAHSLAQPQDRSSQATDYNSSRSNNESVADDGDDLTLRKRPGVREQGNDRVVRKKPGRTVTAE